MNDEFKVELDMEQKLCNSCKKSSTDYYEMVLHLRFKYSDLAEDFGKPILIESTM